MTRFKSFKIATKKPFELSLQLAPKIKNKAFFNSGTYNLVSERSPNILGHKSTPFKKDVSIIYALTQERFIFQFFQEEWHGFYIE